MERGLRLAQTVSSYDRTYYVPARRPTSMVYDTPQLETAVPPPYGSPPRRGDSRRYLGKGSMYEQDMKEREKMYAAARPTSTRTVYRVKTVPAREVDVVRWV